MKNRWNDHYTRKARNEKWLARSVYKLKEIDNKYTIIRKGYRVLDLGCYPGSWSQYCLKKVGTGGEVIGLDKTKPDRLTSVHFQFLEADIMDLKIDQLKHQVGEMDVVLSDLAPRTTGIRITDTSRSMELAEKALEIGLAVLKTGGHFLCKIFEGEDVKAFRDLVSNHFNQMRSIRPSAVRKGSRERYILGLKLIK